MWCVDILLLDLDVWHRDWIQFKVVKQTTEREKTESTAERYHKIIYSIVLFFVRLHGHSEVICGADQQLTTGLSTRGPRQRRFKWPAVQCELQTSEALT